MEKEVNKFIHLCDKCMFEIATCKSKPQFGEGFGKDNVYKCDIYKPFMRLSEKEVRAIYEQNKTDIETLQLKIKEIGTFASTQITIPLTEKLIQNNLLLTLFNL